MRVIVTLTSIPTREDSVLKTVQSILRGSVKPDVIYVNIPNHYVRFDSQFNPEIKKKLEILDTVQVNTMNEDYGAFNKIIPTLKLENDSDTCIVIIDDDASYAPRFLEGLIEGYKQFNSVVGYSGTAYPETAIQYTGQLRHLLVQGHGKDTEILEGGFGVLFPRYVFDSFPLFYPMTKNNTNMYLSDDYVIGKFLDSKGFKKKVIYHSWAGRAGDDWSTICSWNEGSQTHSLSKLGNLERYMELNL